MVLQAALRMRHRGCVSETFRGETVLMQVSGERGYDVWVLRAATPADVDQALRDCEEYVHRALRAVDPNHPRLQHTAEIVDRAPTSVVFRGVNSPAGPVAALRETACSILWPLVYRDGLEFYTLLAPDRAGLADAVARLGTQGEVAVERAAEVAPSALGVGGRFADLAAGLTPRQLEVLRGAARSGYYEVPRQANGAAIARRMGLARATFQEHLRKAERQVLKAFLDVVDRHPGLADAARVRPGRPRGLRAPRGRRR